MYRHIRRQPVVGDTVRVVGNLMDRHYLGAIGRVIGVEALDQPRRRDRGKYVVVRITDVSATYRGGVYPLSVGSSSPYYMDDVEVVHV